MILDSKEQQDMILACLNSVQIGGSVVEKFYELKEAVKNAIVTVENKVAE